MSRELHTLARMRNVEVMEDVETHELVSVGPTGPEPLSSKEIEMRTLQKRKVHLRCLACQKEWWTRPYIPGIGPVAADFDCPNGCNTQTVQ